MAKPKRIGERVVYWRFKGQAKVHQLRYFVALVPDAADEAAAANEEFIDALDEYNGACETGTAVIVSHPGGA